MDWRKRLIGIAMAGGAVAVGVTACWGGGTCNANPDPCCGDPNGNACASKKACEAEGGTFEFNTTCVFDAGSDAADANADANDAQTDAKDAQTDAKVDAADAQSDASADASDAADQ